MPLEELLSTSTIWLAKGGVALLGLTLIAFIARWGIRFRLVGVSSFTLLLSVSCWAFGLSYTPRVQVDGALRAPIVFDNGDDLVVASLSSGHLCVYAHFPEKLKLQASSLNGPIPFEPFAMDIVKELFSRVQIFHVLCVIMRVWFIHL